MCIYMFHYLQRWTRVTRRNQWCSSLLLKQVQHQLTACRQICLLMYKPLSSSRLTRMQRQLRTLYRPHRQPSRPYQFPPNLIRQQLLLKPEAVCNWARRRQVHRQCQWEAVCPLRESKIMAKSSHSMLRKLTSISEVTISSTLSNLPQRKNPKTFLAG